MRRLFIAGAVALALTALAGGCKTTDYQLQCRAECSEMCKRAPGRIFSYTKYRFTCNCVMGKSATWDGRR